MSKFNLFFVSPFDDQSDALWKEALQPTVTKVSKLEDYVINATRADFELKGLEFAGHLHEHLDRADMCLCDIRGLNPNVMYELGYARAVGKKTIIIKTADTDAPVDITDKYVQDYDPEDLVSLGHFLQSAIVRAVEDVLLRRARTRPQYDVTCYKDRNSSDLGEEIASASERIDILETNVVTIAKHHLPNLKTALKKNPDLAVRILTLDPDSSFVNNRASQLGVPVGQYRLELHGAIKELQKGLAEYSDRVLFRIYNDFPTQITFIVDGTVYSCSIARGNRSRNLCTFRLHVDDPGAEKSFGFHFESVWGFGEIYLPFDGKTLM